MQTIEELRHILADLQEEAQALRSKCHQGEMLLSALESLLEGGGAGDPFSQIFKSLGALLQHDEALVLLAQKQKAEAASLGNEGRPPGAGEKPPQQKASRPVGVGARLVCVAASEPCHIGLEVLAEKTLAKVLKGRAMLSLAGAANPILSADTRAALYLPIAFGQAQGVMVLWRNQADARFSRQDLELGRRFAPLTTQALSMLERTRVEEANRLLRKQSKVLERQAHYDHLTGLPNRIKITEVLELEIARSSAERPVALAFMDLNKFKKINDYYGHDIGDALLVAVARALRGVLPPVDHVARISGDEFLIVVTSAGDGAALHFLVDQILETLNTTFELEGFHVPVRASIGVSSYPKHATDAEHLRRGADAAMYHAKAANDGLAVFFDDKMGAELTAKMALENRLRAAISKRAFVPFFQPKIDLRENCLQGFEVLLRWRLEDGTIVGPGNFIATAEELGLLDRIILQCTADVAQLLPQLMSRFGDRFKISLNVTPTQLKNGTFLKDLLHLAEESALHQRLIFEITEDEALDVAFFQDSIRPQLERSGVLISIDDFGTGYSNLAQLAALRAYELKIDRALVSGIHGDPVKQKIVSMICAIARGAGERTVAEGVETPQELTFLLEHTTVDTVQGFIFGRPMPVEALMEWSFEAPVLDPGVGSRTQVG